MSNHDDLMMQLVEMSGCDPDTALHFLEMSNYDLQTAIELMFSDSNQLASNSSPNADEINKSSESNRDSPTSYVGDDFASVRKADPVQQQVLLDYSSESRTRQLAMETNLAFSRAEDSSVEWMFPPPNHLSYPGNLAEARSVAVKDNKWILVNIQCDKEFSSHLLNRDVWTNETLVSLIRSNFVFWQRGRTSQDGEMFASMHRLDPEVGGQGFPMIGIVDSRTGALISEISVGNKTTANDLTMKLMEFLETNDLKNVQAPTCVRPRTSSKSQSFDASRIVDDVNEEELDDDNDEENILELAAAIKASLDLPPPPHVKDVVADTVKEDSPISLSLYAGISMEETTEPEDVNSSIKISLKLVPELLQAIANKNGSKVLKSLVRTFHVERHSVQHVYAAVHYLIQDHVDSLPPDSQSRGFDLFTAFPRQSLGTKRELSVVEAGLKGAQVIMQWL